MSIVGVKRWVISAFSEIPIIGYLALCGVKEHKAAFKDFSVTVLFSTATFWLSALVLRGLTANSSQTYFDMLRSTVQSGELFIFSLGFMGPILLIAAEDPKNARPFPGRLGHIVCLFALALIAVAFFALMKVSNSKNLVLPLNKEFLFSTSVCVALISALLRYLAMVYRKQTIDPEHEIKDRERAFSDKFREHAQSGGGNGQHS